MNIAYPTYAERQRIEADARALRAQVMRDGLRAMGRGIASVASTIAHSFHRVAPN